MKRSIEPSVIEGTVRAQPSKSMMQRAIAAALLNENPVKILNPSFCSDSLAALNVAERLGARILREENSVTVGGGLNPDGTTLHCGESGLCLRMFAPIAALCDRELTLTGECSLKSRPVTMIVRPLQELGCRVVTQDGYPPIRVQGPVRGGTAEVDGRISSQFLTGLLIALPMAEGDSRISVRSLASRPYIDMTLKMLEDFQVTVRHDGYGSFFVPGRQKYRGSGYRVEGDWSSASFIMVAAAVGGRVRITGLDIHSPQADRKILEALKDAGARLKITADFVEVEKGELNPFRFDAIDCPDLFPPLVALACHCHGVSRIEGVERLRFKESDRATALAEEFSAIGAAIEMEKNAMKVTGGKLDGGPVSSHNDHRIAMAAATAAIAAEHAVTIENSESVAKSYPAFFDDLAAIGGRNHE